MSDASPDDPKRDLLLERYREANALDPARPGAALRENVLAHARSAAADRAASRPRPRSGAAAANDSIWSWKAVASLAVVGMVGLLVLQFDRGTTEEKEVAFGTSAHRPAAASAHAPAAEPVPVPAQKPAPQAVPSVTPAPPTEGVPREAKRQSSARTMPSATTPEAPAVGASRQERSVPAPASDAASLPPAPAPGAADNAVAPAAMPAPSPAQLPPTIAAPAPMAKAVRPATPPAPGAPALARERREYRAEEPLSAPAVADSADATLHAAVAAGDRPSVRQWLSQGHPVDQRDSAGRTALMLAARRGDMDMVRLLLSAGADRTLKDPQGLTAADHAAQAGHDLLLPLLR